jgi:hypothetical protein
LCNRPEQNQAMAFTKSGTIHQEPVEPVAPQKRRGYVRRKSYPFQVGHQYKVDVSGRNGESLTSAQKTWTSFLRRGVGYCRKSALSTTSGAKTEHTEASRLDRMVLLDIFGFSPKDKAKETLGNKLPSFSRASSACPPTLRRTL